MISYGQLTTLYMGSLKIEVSRTAGQGKTHSISGVPIMTSCDYAQYSLRTHQSKVKRSKIQEPQAKRKMHS